MFSHILLSLAAIVSLPEGSAPSPVICPHFPNALYAFVWRNWQLVPVDRMASVVGASPEQILQIGHGMGLNGPPEITPEQQRRSCITVIRRNWHILPYEQLLDLLGWTESEMAYTLREDDFLFHKLGNLKPKCAPIRYAEPDAETRLEQERIAKVVERFFPGGVGLLNEPLFDFIQDLSAPLNPSAAFSSVRQSEPRFCYSYFALYGDPLLDPSLDPYPDGYLARLAQLGVNGVWLQGVLYKLSEFPWDPSLSEGFETRLENLRQLVARTKQKGIGVYLYLNEPRAMPESFHQKNPGLKGVSEGDYSTLCSSVPEVQAYLTHAVESICRAVPDLAGFFTITASENLTNCWSHYQGAHCPRCSSRPAGDVIAEINQLIQAGIERAGSSTRLIAWDWGWQDDWAIQAIEKLPPAVSLMSVSEWSTPIQRGGVNCSVGEYSISTIGPGPRATRHWEAAHKSGLKTLAKVQAGNTWELSSVPYIPALENVAKHAANLRSVGVDGLMLGWTLGGYPSPNLEVFSEIGRDPNISTDDALIRVAERRFGTAVAPAIVQAWRSFSTAFSEFPFHGSLVYLAPLQMGPANPLWEQPTGYRATMVGFPYDDLDSWRASYPPEVYTGQFRKIADGFDDALEVLHSSIKKDVAVITQAQRMNLERELVVAQAAAIHFRSVLNQAEFVVARKAYNESPSDETRQTLERCLISEIDLAQRLYALQASDSRLGFEASNHYFYVPMDLAEKVLNCQDLLKRWLNR